MVEIVDFLNNVNTKNFVEAEKQFSELLNDRLADKLQGEKEAVAARIFNGVEVEDIEPSELEAEVEPQTEEETSEEEPEE